MRVKIASIVAAVGIVVLVAGCGGPNATAPITTLGPTGASGVAGTVTPETFIAEGDGVCTAAYAALADLPVNVTGDQAAVLVSGMVDSLRAIGDPGAENKGDLDQFYAELKTAARDYKHGNVTGAEAALDSARAAAADYGFKDCAKKSTARISGAGANAGGTATPPDTPVAPAEPTPAPAPEPTPAPAPVPPAGGTGDAVPPTPPDGGGGGSSGNTGGVSAG